MIELLEEIPAGLTRKHLRVLVTVGGETRLADIEYVDANVAFEDVVVNVDAQALWARGVDGSTALRQRDAQAALAGLSADAIRQMPLENLADTVADLLVALRLDADRQSAP